MDDLVVIIITLIFVVVGTLGQIKKKKPLPQNPDQQKKPPGFWDLLKEEADYQEQEPGYTPNEELATEPGFQGENPDYQLTVNNEPKSVFCSEKNKRKKEEIKEIKTKEKFSLRKAVIYSEILNRKYT